MASKESKEVVEVIRMQRTLATKIELLNATGLIDEATVLGFILGYAGGVCRLCFGDRMEPRARLLRVMEAKLVDNLIEPVPKSVDKGAPLAKK